MCVCASECVCVCVNRELGMLYIWSGDKVSRIIIE